jgi:hypothetical protein
MRRDERSRGRVALAVVGLGTALVIAPAVAQTPPPNSAPSLPTPAPGKPTDMLEGSVKKLDPEKGTIEVYAGPLGIFGKTLEVNTSTEIQVEGRPGTLADLREGASIKASYDGRDGRNVATRIEVMPAR